MTERHRQRRYKISQRGKLSINIACSIFFQDPDVKEF